MHSYEISTVDSAKVTLITYAVPVKYKLIPSNSLNIIPAETI